MTEVKDKYGIVKHEIMVNTKVRRKKKSYYMFSHLSLITHNKYLVVKEVIRWIC